MDGSVTDTALGTVTTTVLSDLSTATPGYGDLTGLTADIAGNRVFETAYERDLLGRITQIHETVDGDERTRRYEYDAAGRLITVRNESSTVLATYAYDANGNRTLVHTPSGDVDLGINLGCLDGSAADEEDRLCRYGDFEYGYDGNGAMNVRTRISTGVSEQFTYDGLGRLVKAVVPGKTIHYVLDGQGRRMGKVVNGTLQKGWVYGSSLLPIAQLSATGAVESTFVYGTRPNVPDYIVATGGTVYRIIADHLGSVRLVVNASTGAIVQRMDYDEWGNVTYESGNTTLHPFGYAGGLYDRDTGLVRFGARDYDPVTGRWTAKDPIKFAAGLTNLFGYVGSDPVNGIDPSGLYGTNDCSYYDQRCAESGGAYYCQSTVEGEIYGGAPYWCRKFPTPPDPDPSRDDDYEGWPRCVRQCLQDCDRDENKDQNMCPAEADEREGPWSPSSTSFTCHKQCYALCAYPGLHGDPFPFPSELVP